MPSSYNNTAYPSPFHALGGNSTALSFSNQLYVVIGRKEATARLFNLVAQLSLRGRLLILDCGNRANLLPLSRELRRLTHDPVKALSNILTARAFTCYQVITLLEQTAHPGPVQQPVVIFDLLSTFYDESVTFTESRRLLGRCLQLIGGMSRAAPVIVNARPPLEDFPQRKMFLDLLCDIAGQVWEEAIPVDERPQQLSLFPGMI